MHMGSCPENRMRVLVLRADFVAGRISGLHLASPPPLGGPTMETKLTIDDYLAPRPIVPGNRFWYPIRIFGHAVFPLKQYSDVPAAGEAGAVRVSDDCAVTDDQIEQLDLSPFNVGMKCGLPSCVTVLEVTSQAAQEWLERKELPRTPRWYGRQSRCYLFNYIRLDQTFTEVRPGLQLLNEGTFVTYPGSIYADDRLVYWEDSPDTTATADLPAWLVPPQCLVHALG